MRSTERLTGVTKQTIGRLLLRAGEEAERVLDAELRNLDCTDIQVDELWTFVAKKQARLGIGDDRRVMGDMWTFIAIDRETKLIPQFTVGKRDGRTTREFIDALAARLSNRVQLSSDAFSAYAQAVDTSFGGEVDYGIVVKDYVAEPIGPGRYAPPRVASVKKEGVLGDPREDRIITSHVECHNRTLRMRCRRFTRLTNAFSKKLESLRAAAALYFYDYNFVRRHGTIRMTPAMAAGVSPHAWTLHDLVDRINANA